MTRELFERGHSAALLPYDPVLDRVLVVEEFRIGHYGAGLPIADCWSPGPIAGMIDDGETPLAAALREAVEEAGLQIAEDDIFDPMTILPSPGGSSEVVSLFLATADLSKVKEGRYGAVSEAEETHTRILTRTEALRLIMSKPVSGLLTALVLRLETLRLAGAFRK
jgi:ADP-ribose pyrophosphatase